jgi:membrane-associated phospholipid phosphatase
VFIKIGVVYILWVWWAAVYLNHHYLVDLLGGLLFVAFAYYTGMGLIEVLKWLFKVDIFNNN